jgi:hypothetical protein
MVGTTQSLATLQVRALAPAPPIAPLPPLPPAPPWPPVPLLPPFEPPFPRPEPASPPRPPLAPPVAMPASPTPAALGAEPPLEQPPRAAPAVIEKTSAVRKPSRRMTCLSRHVPCPTRADEKAAYWWGQCAICAIPIRTPSVRATSGACSGLALRAGAHPGTVDALARDIVRFQERADPLRYLSAARDRHGLALRHGVRLRRKCGRSHGRTDRALRLNVHFHVLALDGVYARDKPSGRF